MHPSARQESAIKSQRLYVTLAGPPPLQKPHHTSRTESGADCPEKRSPPTGGGQCMPPEIRAADKQTAKAGNGRRQPPTGQGDGRYVFPIRRTVRPARRNG
ncbi:hypothetical protein HPB47_003108 [Ixodes persulcatus]|uniref:Uncharacterized protein n=1 Tax=Ixodes persulcatus TaxID=34615 RepID=A0AC60PJD5_IXOPE|nr:hypothetical protein HPB47_003108 [Ixodes persulcatus]